MAKLLVTPEEVIAKANEVTGKKEEMSELKTQMHNLVMELNSAWESESGQAFISKYPSVDSNVQRALERLQTHTTNLQRAAQEYESVESELTSRSSSLSDGTIF